MARLWWVLLRATWGWDGFFLSPNFNWFEWINEMAKSWKQPGVYFTQRFFKSILIVSSLKKERKKVKATRRSGSISFFNSSVNSLRFFFCPVVYKSWCLTPQSPGPLVPSAAPRLHSLSQAAVTVPLPCQPASQPASQPHACLLSHWWSSEAEWLTDRVTHQPPNGFSKNTAQHPRELY